MVMLEGECSEEGPRVFDLREYINNHFLPLLTTSFTNGSDKEALFESRSNIRGLPLSKHLVNGFWLLQNFFQPRKSIANIL